MENKKPTVMMQGHPADPSRSVPNRAVSVKKLSRRDSITSKRQPWTTVGQEIEGEFYDFSEDDFVSFGGFVLAENKERISFITNQSFDIETPVLIRRKTSRSPYRNNGLDKVKHAQIVACRRTRSKSGEVAYRVDAASFGFSRNLES